MVVLGGGLFLMSEVPLSLHPWDGCVPGTYNTCTGCTTQCTDCITTCVATCHSYVRYSDRLREGYRESRRCSRATYPESYITKYTSIRRFFRLFWRRGGPGEGGCARPPASLYNTYIGSIIHVHALQHIQYVYRLYNYLSRIFWGRGGPGGNGCVRPLSRTRSCCRLTTDPLPRGVPTPLPKGVGSL